MRTNITAIISRIIENLPENKRKCHNRRTLDCLKTLYTEDEWLDILLKYEI